jgi:hypothetical protein
MATRRPLVVVSGVTSELPVGDSITGATAGTLVAGSGLDGGGAFTGGIVTVNASIAPAASGLIFAGDALAIDGSAQASGNAALAAASTASSSAATALASGNAALTDLTSKVSKAGDIVSGTLVVDSQSYGVVSNTVGSGVILLDFSANNNFDVTLQGDSTLAPSVSPSGGQSGAIYIRQDGTGSRLLSYSGGWSFSNGSAPTLTLTASGTDLLAYYAPSSSTIIGNLIAAVSGV